MKNLVIIAFAFLMGSCNKEDESSSKQNIQGKCIFYSDVFVAVNCKINNVSIYVDEKYVGQLTNTHLPLTDELNYGTQDVLSNLFSIGKHSYLAKIDGCSQNKWEGSFEINSDNVTKIKLDYLTSKP